MSPSYIWPEGTIYKLRTRRCMPISRKGRQPQEMAGLRDDSESEKSHEKRTWNLEPFGTNVCSA
ncbi:hypothetical protein PHLCEN_2v4844 [Hermanssonia centrifuga]|uniref:Uncharacterized protein n=1 Tax=Hermanssonia centrifuga TaxID=98765 RepID=A0A2R6PGU3_9APHY|nr:hypothetical protein PHLCEN_2v4844 [Hermanssonia centrifuga]